MMMMMTMMNGFCAACVMMSLTWLRLGCRSVHLQGRPEQPLPGVRQLQPQDLRLLEGGAGAHGVHQPAAAAGGEGAVQRAAEGAASGWVGDGEEGGGPRRPSTDVIICNNKKKNQTINKANSNSTFIFYCSDWTHTVVRNSYQYWSCRAGEDVVLSEKKIIKNLPQVSTLWHQHNNHCR